MIESVETIYDNGDRSKHSKFLNSFFSINNRGVDYYNPNNISFEFKESYMSDKKNIFFKIPEHQINESDFFIFCVNYEKFYLVSKLDIRENFDCKCKSKKAHIRINTVKLFSFYSNENILIFKNYIDKIKEVDM